MIHEVLISSNLCQRQREDLLGSSGEGLLLSYRSDWKMRKKGGFGRDTKAPRILYFRITSKWR
jgi:hypothetical protein